MTSSCHIMKSHNFLFPNKGFLLQSKLSMSAYLHTVIPQASQTQKVQNLAHHLLPDILILQVFLNRNLSTALAPCPSKHPVLQVLPSKFSSNLCTFFPSQGPCSLSNLFTYESRYFPYNPATLSFIQVCKALSCLLNSIHVASLAWNVHSICPASPNSYLSFRLCLNLTSSRKILNCPLSTLGASPCFHGLSLPAHHATWLTALQLSDCFSVCLFQLEPREVRGLLLLYDTPSM